MLLGKADLGRLFFVCNGYFTLLFSKLYLLLGKQKRKWKINLN